MGKRFQFSIVTLLSMTLLTALGVKFLPLLLDRQSVDVVDAMPMQVSATYIWYHDARAMIAYDGSYLRNWEHASVKPGAGNVIHIDHLVHPVDQGILGGSCHHDLHIQLPLGVKNGDRFDINIAARDRKDTPTNDGAISAMENAEATVVRFYEPEFEPMTDREFDSIGWIKILSIDQNAVTIRCELNDDATMRDWGHGIPKKLTLKRKPIPIAR